MLQKLAGCDDGRTCPGMWIDEDTDEVLVRGRVETSTLPLGDGEQVVVLPAGMLEEATQRLGR